MCGAARRPFTAEGESSPGRGMIPLDQISGSWKGLTLSQNPGRPALGGWVAGVPQGAETRVRGCVRALSKLPRVGSLRPHRRSADLHTLGFESPWGSRKPRRKKTNSRAAAWAAARVPRGPGSPAKQPPAFAFVVWTEISIPPCSPMARGAGSVAWEAGGDPPGRCTLTEPPGVGLWPGSRPAAPRGSRSSG